MNEKMISERDAVMRERAAAEYGFTCAALRLYEQRVSCPNRAAIEKDAETFAKERFPLPKVTRPRVVADPHSGFTQRWRVRGGMIEWEASYDGKGDKWESFEAEYGTSYGTVTNINTVTPERIRVWADLLANPTEEVEEDSHAS